LAAEIAGYIYRQKMPANILEKLPFGVFISLEIRKISGNGLARQSFG
jgi:hypothetical protein